MVEDTQKRYADDITVRELVRLRTENERMRKALLFYANEDHYESRLMPSTWGEYEVVDVLNDNGELARVALDGGKR